MNDNFRLEKEQTWFYQKQRPQIPGRTKAAQFFSAKIFFNRKAEDEEEEEPKTIICVTQPKTPKRINRSLLCNYQVK